MTEVYQRGESEVPTRLPQFRLVGRAVKPRLLDLFCGAGGCSAGYERAGFEVVGVDINPQPNYPFEFIQGDALSILERMMEGAAFTARMPGTTAQFGLLDFCGFHASPPCQFATDYIRTGNVGASPNLIPPTRELLQRMGLPYVIENVAGARAELREPIMLCGSAFGLDVQRHRLFETTFPLMSPGCVHGVWGRNRFPGGRSKERTGSSRGLVRSTVEVGSWDIPLHIQERAMGINWMTLEELSQAIPPAYTEHVGAALLAHLNATQKAAA